jgi:signal transduction histidine kinase
MPRNSFPSLRTNRTGLVGLAAVYVCYIAVILRTLARQEIQFLLPVYLALEFVSLVLFTLMLLRPISRPIWQHLYFALQTLLVLILLLLFPVFDFIAVLFVTLSYEAALVFPGIVRWRWVVVLIVLIGLPLIASQGMYGLALSLMPITACILFLAVSVNQEKNGLRASQALLVELQAPTIKTAYTAQVEELSIIQEHNRLARQLHDSVSQTINSIIHLNQAAHVTLEHDTGQLDSQLEQLQVLTQSSLEQMRGLIASLRPPENRSAERPTPYS